MANIDIPIGTSVATANTAIDAAAAGDVIRFERGGTYVGKVSINDSGASGNVITVTAYGTGANPIITTRIELPGWNTEGNWTDMGGNVWRKSLTINDQNTNFRFWLNGTEYARSENAAEVTITRRTSYNTDIIHQLYVYATSNPALFYSSIEYNGTEQCALLLNNNAYITITDLDIGGGCGACIDVDFASNIIIEDCNIGAGAGKIGIRANGTCDNVIIRNNVIDSGDRTPNDFYTLWGINDGIYMKGGCTNWRIYNNWIHDWGHSCIELSNVASGATDMTGNWIYENYLTAEFVDYCRGFTVDSLDGRDSSGNKVYRNYIHKTSINCQLNCEGLEVTYNIINEVRNSLTGPEGSGRGFDISGYGGTSPVDMKVYNNVIANCASEGIRVTRSSGYTEATGNEFINNIFYNNGDETPFGFDDPQIILAENGGTLTLGNTFQNNLLYKSGVTDRIFYDSRNAGNEFMTLAEFNARNGVNNDVMSDNISDDPLFTDANNDFSLQGGSPSIGAGLTLGASFEDALLSGSTWPDGVLVGTQPTPWNIGSFVTGALQKILYTHAGKLLVHDGKLLTVS